MVGLFINTIPLRVNRDNNETLSQHLRRIQQQSREFNNYQHLPLAEIQANHPLKNQLIPHLLVFENYPLEEELGGLSRQRDGFAVTHIEGREQTHYDLTVGISPGKSINIKFTFNCDLLTWTEISQLSCLFMIPH